MIMLPATSTPSSIKLDRLHRFSEITANGRQRHVARRGKLFCARGGTHYRPGVFGKNRTAMAGAAVLLLALAACEKEKTILPMSSATTNAPAHKHTNHLAREKSP